MKDDHTEIEDKEATPDCRAEATPEVIPVVASDPAGGPATDPNDLPTNVIVVTFDKQSKWWTARSGPAAAGMVATSHKGAIEAISALVVSLAFSGSHGFDPDFTG